MTFQIILLIIIMLINSAALIILLRKNKENSDQKINEIRNSIIKFDSLLEKYENTLRNEFKNSREESRNSAKESREELAFSLNKFSNQFNMNVKELNHMIKERFADFNRNQTEINRSSSELIKELKETTEKQLGFIREDNSKKLEEMRKTVDEKLQTTLEKRLGESFRQVSTSLEQVHKGLGEMQSLATGVGDLKKVLSNVKTRGVLGEYQLGNILEQILTTDQYSVNVATKKGSQANVEYAVKLPGKESDSEVWLPVDSKFPIETYNSLLEAYERGVKEEIEIQQKNLVKRIELFAKDISSKYLDPPHTTDFAIMFLPVESLYAEILRHPGLFEKLQRTYRITVTGPTTLSALLNSLQMGFRTLAVQKKSSKVWEILESVKTEFSKFSEQLEKVDIQIGKAQQTLGKLKSTRTNAMNRKLRDIESLEESTENQLKIT